MYEKVVLFYMKYRSLVRYVFWGGMTTLINIVSFWLFVDALKMNYQFANVISWFITVLAVYFTNKVWVFESEYSTIARFAKELLMFFASRIITLGIDVLVLFIGIQILHGNNLVIKIIDNVIVIIVNYIFSKYIIFKK